jgi:hypothetical protein
VQREKAQRDDEALEQESNRDDAVKEDDPEEFANSMREKMQSRVAAAERRNVRQGAGADGGVGGAGSNVSISRQVSV